MCTAICRGLLSNIIHSDISVTDSHLDIVGGQQLVVAFPDDFLQGTIQLVIDEGADGRIARGRHLIQKPEKPDVYFAQLLDLPEGGIASLHEGKQYHFQCCLGINPLF